MALSSRSVRFALALSVVAAASFATSCSSESDTTGAGGSGGAITGAGGASSSGSTTSSSASTTGVSTSSASVTTGTSTTGSAGGGGPPCIDSGPGEPNEEELDAYQLAAMDDDTSPGTINGVLEGPGDVDWYLYVGTDTFGPGNTVDPTAGLDVGTATARVCAFFECLSADIDAFDCPGATTSETSPDGRAGCCGHEAFTIEINCVNTASDDAKVYLRVDDPEGSVCDEYVVSYHY